MGRKVVSMESKLAAVLAEVGSNRVTVMSVCEKLQISRQSYYVYWKRFRVEGPPGLIERSRRPKSSPTATPEEMVARIVAVRALLAEEGWDNGATSIYYRLLAEGVQPPTRRTIHRVLVRAGLVGPAPGKRPRSSFRRFQFPATDDCWQLDAFEFRLATGQVVVVFELRDDRSRYLLNTLAWAAETTLGAWTCVIQAVVVYGLPLMLLADNSLAHTGRLIGIMVLFERNLAALGVRLIHSTPRHPWTCGKIERGHGTAQKWLAARPAPATIEDLQQLLNRYRAAFNRRPHQALDGNTPLEQRTASRRTTPRPGQDPSVPATTVTMLTANSRGAIKIGGCTIGLGMEYAGQPMIVFRTGDQAQIYYRQFLVYDLTLDRSRSYQPARPRGGPHQPRAGHYSPLTAPRSSTTAIPAGDAAAVKMEPPTGGTILTAASPGIPFDVEELSTMS
jgi:transposase InsO family protein